MITDPSAHGPTGKQCPWNERLHKLDGFLYRYWRDLVLLMCWREWGGCGGWFSVPHVVAATGATAGPPRPSNGPEARRPGHTPTDRTGNQTAGARARTLTTW